MVTVEDSEVEAEVALAVETVVDLEEEAASAEIAAEEAASEIEAEEEASVAEAAEEESV